MKKRYHNYCAPLFIFAVMFLLFNTYKSNDVASKIKVLFFLLIDPHEELLIENKRSRY